MQGKKLGFRKCGEAPSLYTRFKRPLSLTIRLTIVRPAGGAVISIVAIAWLLLEKLGPSLPAVTVAVLVSVPTSLFELVPTIRTDIVAKFARVRLGVRLRL